MRHGVYVQVILPPLIGAASDTDFALEVADWPVCSEDDLATRKRFLDATGRTSDNKRASAARGSISSSQPM